MALIYLRHPLHGEKAESNDMITYLDKKAGWVEFDPVEEAAAKIEQEPEPEHKTKGKKVKVEAPAVIIPDFLKD